MKVANVIVDVPTMQTNRPYSYLIPEDLQDTIQLGMRVVVPFGRGSRLVQGFVVSFDDEVIDQQIKLKSLVSLTDPIAVLNAELLALAKWLAEINYAFSISVLQAMLPNVMRAKYSKTLQVLDREKIIDPKIQLLFSDRYEIPYDQDNISMENMKSVQKYIRQGIIQIGYEVANRAHAKKVVAAKPLLDFSAYQKIRQNLRPTAKKQARLLTYLMQNQDVMRPVKDIITLIRGDYGVINQGEEKGWLVKESVEQYRLPTLSMPIEHTEALTLNEQQQNAFNRVSATIKASRQHTFLLEGVTGSGKTEVYLQTIAYTLAQGKTALMLVPEITLTPQMVRRVQGRFGDDVAVMHSGLSDGERYDEWRRVQRGEVHVVVGARSAIFAPLTNIGLIIIDEEHESTYKQEENPRYHARDVALWRAEYNHAVVLLGSATPSLESRARAQQGVFELITLTKRAQENSMLPDVDIVDMRESIMQGGDDLFSTKLQAAIQMRLDKQEQSVLMLNRRGYANFLMCRNCGYVEKCVNCDLSLTIHRDTGRLECHYCGYAIPIPTVCSQCQSERIRPYGTGIQKVEEELLRLFPNARVIRMDADTTRKKGATDKMLARFGKHDADILLGTQMIAKGLDFPNVTLVGVLNADTVLGLPDYRASEKTFQLLTQVAGRAGRSEKKGEVIIQTFNPEHYAIQFAQNHDYESFYRYEMALRHTWQYSPYFYTIQVKFAHESQNEAAKAAYQTTRWLTQKIASDTTILGPSIGAISRLKNKYYYRIVIKYRHDSGLNEALTELVSTAQWLQKQGVTLMIDRDPVNFI